MPDLVPAVKAFLGGLCDAFGADWEFPDDAAIRDALAAQEATMQRLALRDAEGNLHDEGSGQFVRKDGSSISQSHLEELDRKIAAKERRYTQLIGDTEHDRQMREYFPLGTGRPGGASSQHTSAQFRKRMDRSIQEAKEAVDLKSELDHLKARREAYAQGQVDEQGRPIREKKEPTRKISEDAKARSAELRRVRQELSMEGKAKLADGSKVFYRSREEGDDLVGEAVLKSPDGTKKTLRAKSDKGFALENAAIALVKEHLTQGQSTAQKPTQAESKKPVTGPAADIATIPEGQSRYVGGYYVSNHGGRYHLQTDRDTINGSPEDVAGYIHGQHESRRHLQPMIDAALERVHKTPPAGFFGGAMEDEIKAFEAMPEGEPVVSLAANTHGRLGKIIRRDGRNTVKLDGTPGYASNDVEPLDKRWSWRARHLGEYTEPERPTEPESVQRLLFSTRKREAGRWITIGAKVGEDGKKHGGSPVFVQNGRIVKGHPGLTGKKIGAFHEAAEPISHRKELAQSREYARAVWGKKAQGEGLDPKHLHQLAAEIQAHDREFKHDHTRMLQEARKLSTGLGYGDISNLAARNAHGQIDADSIRGLDDVAERMAERYPEFFHGHEPADRLFDLLVGGNPEPMTEDEAYEQAFDHLMEQRHEEENDRDKYRVREGEVIPFSLRKKDAAAGLADTIIRRGLSAGVAVSEEIRRAVLAEAAKLVKKKSPSPSSSSDAGGSSPTMSRS